MLKLNSTLTSLLVAAAATGAIAFAMEQWRQQRLSARAQPAQVTVNAVRLPKPFWAASAPGRVEPRNGEIRITAQMPGKVTHVLVRMNDTVKGGDLLIKLNDDEPMAKLAAAVTEVAARRRERDTETVAKPAADRRTAEDALANADYASFRARLDLDQLQLAAASGPVSADVMDAARKTLREANDRLESERNNLRRAQTVAGLPAPSRLDASLAAARSELSLIQTAIERTRIRAPATGTVLQINTRVGETVTPSPEDVLLVFGDLSSLRVTAEIEERDIAKVRVGQAVVVRSDTFPEHEFAGTVDRMAQALGAQRLPGKGPRRPTDFDVLQVQITLDGRPDLLPGMRVDVFFKPDSGSKAAAAADIKAN